MSKWIIDDKVREKIVTEIDALVGTTDVIGTTEELFEELTKRVVGRSGEDYWPNSTDSFERHLREIEGTLSSVGVSVLWMDYEELSKILEREEIMKCRLGDESYRLETPLIIFTRHLERYR
jgi:hypothetical protein